MWESADHLFHKKRARQRSRILGTKYGKCISREGGGLNIFFRKMKSISLLYHSIAYKDVRVLHINVA